jgi:methyl-accepting chemotaxis protein
MMQNADNPKSKPLSEDIKETADKIATFQDAIDQMQEGTRQLNQTFGQTRQRAVEMMKEVSDTALRIVRLGGNMKDVYETMNDVSKATGKNVIINAEAAGKLYATSKVLVQDVGDLVKKFADVGIQFSKIDDMMADATEYVRDMGLNTKEVMDQVVDNFQQMNKFNFEGGVQGMTKMAAKAVMFRIDMREALDLANETMNPENAIKVASAFQRLGVAAGNMTDPFALMNASINDPGALQDTIVNIGKQFTYFDEKTKSFKINPQGLLTLRELSKETGISYESLTKAGLAASELDKRLSQISPRVTFKNEEDKQFLTNLAQMNDEGEYTVKISDQETKKLSEVTQEEFDKLIKQQKEAPKDMEDVARRQLGSVDLIKADTRAIFEIMSRGAASTRTVRETAEGARRLSENTLGVASKELVESNVIGRNFDKIAKTLEDEVRNSLKGKDVTFDDIKEKLGGSLGKFETEVTNFIKTTSVKVSDKLKESGKRADESTLELAVRTALEKFQKPTQITTANASNQSSGYESGILGGVNNTQKVEETKNRNETITQTVKQLVDLGGTITVKIEASPGVSTQQMQEYVNSGEIKSAFWGFVEKQLIQNGTIKNTTLTKPY